MIHLQQNSMTVKCRLHSAIGNSFPAQPTLSARHRPALSNSGGHPNRLRSLFLCAPEQPCMLYTSVLFLRGCDLGFLGSSLLRETPPAQSRDSAAWTLIQQLSAVTVSLKHCNVDLILRLVAYTSCSGAACILSFFLHQSS